MSEDLFPDHDHDHEICTQSLIALAERQCAAQGLRLTSLRRAVLLEVAASHKAVGAYDILDCFASRGKKVAPISVYRSLEFLQEAGFIHRLASLNAYFACQRSCSSEVACSAQPLVFLICNECGVIGEADGKNLTSLVSAYAADGNFQTMQSQLEIGGLCRFCQNLAEEGGVPA